MIQESALHHPNNFGIIFDSGPALRARIIRIIFDTGLDPRSKIPGRSSLGILDPVLARIIRIILESFLIRARIQDPRSWIRARIKNDSKMIRMIRASTGSKIPREDLPGILDFGSWIKARIKHDSKMIRMIWAGPESKIIRMIQAPPAPCIDPN